MSSPIATQSVNVFDPNFHLRCFQESERTYPIDVENLPQLTQRALTILFAQQLDPTNPEINQATETFFREWKAKFRDLNDQQIDVTPSKTCHKNLKKCDALYLFLKTHPEYFRQIDLDPRDSHVLSFTEAHPDIQTIRHFLGTHREAYLNLPHPRGLEFIPSREAYLFKGICNETIQREVLEAHNAFVLDSDNSEKIYSYVESLIVCSFHFQEMLSRLKIQRREALQGKINSQFQVIDQCCLNLKQNHPFSWETYAASAMRMELNGVNYNNIDQVLDYINQLQIAATLMPADSEIGKILASNLSSKIKHIARYFRDTGANPTWMKIINRTLDENAVLRLFRDNPSLFDLARSSKHKKFFESHPILNTRELFIQFYPNLLISHFYKEVSINNLAESIYKMKGKLCNQLSFEFTPTLFNKRETVEFLKDAMLSNPSLQILFTRSEDSDVLIRSFNEDQSIDREVGDLLSQPRKIGDLPLFYILRMDPQDPLRRK